MGTPSRLYGLVACVTLLGSAAESSAKGEDKRDPIKWVPGATSDGVQFLATTPTLHRTLQLANEARRSSVKVRVTPFRDALGNLHELEYSFERKATTLTISATLAAEGIYTSEIQVATREGRSATRITVKRESQELPVRIMGLGPFASSATFFGDDEVPLWFSIDETKGFGIEVTPSVTSFVRSGEAATQIDFALTKASPVSLNPSETKLVSLMVRGLDGAGVYRGTLRLSSPHYRPQDRDFTVTLKAGVTALVVFILLGVAVSFLVQWLMTRRPRLANQQRITKYRTALERLMEISGACAPAEERVITNLRTEIRNASESDAPTSEIKVALKRLAEKLTILPIWLRGRRRIEVLEPLDLRDPFRQQLSDAEAWLLSSSGEPKTELRKLRNGLETMPAAIDEAIRKALEARLSAFVGDLSAQHVSGDVLGKAKEAQAAVKDGHPNRAMTLLTEAEHALVVIQTNRLKERMQDQPGSATEEEWQTSLKGIDWQIERALTATSTAEAAEAQRAGWLIYLSALWSTTEAQLQKAERKVASGRDVDPDEKEDREKSVAEMKRMMAQLKADLEGQADPTHLQQAYRAVAGKWGAYVERYESHRGAGALDLPMITEAARSPTSIQFQTSAQEPPMLLYLRIAADMTVTEEARLHVGDAITNGLILLVAVLLGVMTLWNPDPTWGSFADGATAFLFGLLLHQVSIDGVSRLTGRFLGS